MSLLRRALRYREEFLENQRNIKSGLLNKTLDYLGFKRIKKLSESDKETTNKFNETEINTIKYFNTINQISKEIHQLQIDQDASKNFHNIILKHFNFTKSILFVYSPIKEKFVFWQGSNINNDIKDKLSFDLKFGGIYKKIIEESSLLILPAEDNFNTFQNILNDSDIDFQLFIPFIFSGRVIGIFLGLKLDNNIPNKTLIDSLEIIGRLNGSLLYNIYLQSDEIDKN